MLLYDGSVGVVYSTGSTIMYVRVSGSLLDTVSTPVQLYSGTSCGHPIIMQGAQFGSSPLYDPTSSTKPELIFLWTDGSMLYSNYCTQLTCSSPNGADRLYTESASFDSLRAAPPVRSGWITVSGVADGNVKQYVCNTKLCTGSISSTYSVAGAAPTTASGNNELAVVNNAGAYPVLLWTEVDSGSTYKLVAIGCTRQFWCSSANSKITVATGVGSTAPKAAIVLPDGRIMVFYVDISYNLRRAVCDNSFCSATTVSGLTDIVSTQDVDMNLDVTYGPNGYPVISFTSSSRYIYVIRCSNLLCTHVSQ